MRGIGIFGLGATVVVLFSTCSFRPDHAEMDVDPEGEKPTTTADTSHLVTWWNGTEDTITSSGWKIEYLVKSDTSEQEDLYLRWSKAGHVNVYCASGILGFALIHIPAYVGESDSMLIFAHACSSTHGGVTALSKTSSRVMRYCGVVGYDAGTGRVLWIPSEAQEGRSPFHATLSHADFGTDTVLQFKGSTSAVIPVTIFDSIRFDDRNIYLIADLVIHEASGSRDVKETLVARTR